MGGVLSCSRIWEGFLTTWLLPGESLPPLALAALQSLLASALPRSGGGRPALLWIVVFSNCNLICAYICTCNCVCNHIFTPEWFPLLQIVQLCTIIFWWSRVVVGLGKPELGTIWPTTYLPGGSLDFESSHFPFFLACLNILAEGKDNLLCILDTFLTLFSPFYLPYAGKMSNLQQKHSPVFLFLSLEHCV